MLANVLGSGENTELLKRLGGYFKVLGFVKLELLFSD